MSKPEWKTEIEGKLWTLKAEDYFAVVGTYESTLNCRVPMWRSTVHSGNSCYVIYKDTSEDAKKESEQYLPKPKPTSVQTIEWWRPEDRKPKPGELIIVQDPMGLTVFVTRVFDRETLNSSAQYAVLNVTYL
jgi:hypothetical protein